MHERGEFRNAPNKFDCFDQRVTLALFPGHLPASFNLAVRHCQHLLRSQLNGYTLNVTVESGRCGKAHKEEAMNNLRDDGGKAAMAIGSTGRPTERKPTEFGHIIVGQLAKLGQTQSWLATEGDVSHTCVSKWIYNPRRQIKDDNVAMLSRLLRVPERQLLSALGPRSVVESKQSRKKAAPAAFERAKTQRRKHLAARVAETTAEKPNVTRGDATVTPDGNTGTAISIQIIRSLLPKLSSEQRLKLLDRFVDRIPLPAQREMTEYVVKMMLDDCEKMLLDGWHTRAKESQK